jgi:hypothetical protein
MTKIQTSYCLMQMLRNLREARCQAPKSELMLGSVHHVCNLSAV